MKIEILALKTEHPDWGNKKIAAFIGCSPNNVKHHLSEKARQQNRDRKRRYDGRLLGILKRKRDNFSRNGDFKYLQKQQVVVRQRQECPFSVKELSDKVTKNPVCYLTGKKIDLLDSRSYHLDHIVPCAKGGTNHLSNCGLASREANLSKSDMTLEEFEKLAISFLKSRGMAVSRGIAPQTCI